MTDTESSFSARIAALARVEKGEAPPDSAAIDAIVASLGADSKEERRRAAGALTAVAARRELVGHVESILDDPDPLRRWGATFALARAGIDSDAVFEGALDALGFEDGDVRWAALEIVVGLARRYDRRTARLKALAREASAAGRKMALYGLRDLEIGDEAIYTMALFSENAGVRLAAISGIARLAATSSQAHDALVVTVERDADPGVRRAAAATLGKVASESPEVRAVLERIRASSTDADLVRAAARGLAKP